MSRPEKKITRNIQKTKKVVLINVDIKSTKTLDELESMKFQGKFKSLPEKNYLKLRNSIIKNGFRIPVFIWKNRLLDGHQRILTLSRMREDGFSIPPVPVFELNADNERDAKKLLLLINSRYGVISEQGFFEFAEEFDVNDLAFEIQIPELKLNVDESDANETLDSVPNTGEDLNKLWKVKRGDVWQIGKHRLMCGDSTSMEDSEILMGQDKAKICWTDPPWNVSYGKTRHPLDKSRQILNDNLGKDFNKFVDSFLKVIYSSIFGGASVYLVMSPQEWGLIMNGLSREGFHWSSTIIWAKDKLVMQRKDYHTQYEPMWYGWKEAEKRIHPIKDRKQSDLWNIKRPHISLEHPTMKPVELVSRSMMNSSDMGDLVFDPFLGSGTTMVASQSAGRICFGMEISDKYCAVIINRMKTLFPELDIKRLIEGKDIKNKKNKGKKNG